MPVKVFICWSGTRSQLFAMAVDELLKAVLGAEVEISISTKIAKGTEWFDELRNALNNADCGILCLTPEAIGSPWVHFEAGLLVRELGASPNPEIRAERERRVFPLLYDVEPGVVKGPLSSYQSTLATDADDVLRLVEAIRQFMPQNPALSRQDVRKICRNNWEAFQAKLDSIQKVTLREIVPEFESLFRRKTFQESMHDCLSQNWLDRFNGARDTQTSLRAHQETVHKACRPFVGDVFDDLVSTLDFYAMGLSRLLGKREFPIDEKTGQVTFDNPGIALACERQRRRIRSVVAQLVDEKQAPVFDEAFRFDAAETFQEQKRLIHRRKAALDREALNTRQKEQIEAKLKPCADSDWDFDRIVYYSWSESRPDPSVFKLLEELKRARREFEKISAKSEGISLMPLNYSLGPLERALSPSIGPTQAREAKALCEDIRKFVEHTGTAAGGQVRATLSRIEDSLPQPASSQQRAAKK
jgi:TIR domain